MLPNFLVPETVADANAFGPALDVPVGCTYFMVTLGVTRTVEQESLEIAIWGSADLADWGGRPLLRFPQKFYCGTYSMMLDLSDHPEIRYLRAEYKMNRWGRGETTPLFGLYVFLEDVGVPQASRVVYA